MTHLDPQTVVVAEAEKTQPEKAVEEHAEEVAAKDPTPEDVQKIALVYAGATIASQNMLMCSGLNGCGALLREDQADRHVQWHSVGKP